MEILSNGGCKSEVKLVGGWSCYGLWLLRFSEQSHTYTSSHLSLLPYFHHLCLVTASVGIRIGADRAASPSPGTIPITKQPSIAVTVAIRLIAGIGGTWSVTIHSHRFRAGGHEWSWNRDHKRWRLDDNFRRWDLRDTRGVDPTQGVAAVVTEGHL